MFRITESPEVDAMSKIQFINIVCLSPPDCVRCDRPTMWANTPARFRVTGAKVTSGARDLCSACYTWLKRHDRAELDNYPRRRVSSGAPRGRYDFINVVMLPPPDCKRCDHPVCWPKTPYRFRPAGARTISGARDLCSPCYRFLLTEDPEGLADFPTRNRRSADTYDAYKIYKQRYPEWTKRQIATELMDISPDALEQAISRMRRLERIEIAA